MIELSCRNHIKLRYTYRMIYLVANIFLCLATFFTRSCGVNQELDDFPQNTVVLRGQSFQLSCGKKTNVSSPIYINWWSSKRNNIAINSEVVSGYDVELYQHRVGSTLSSAGDYDTAGTYKCSMTYPGLQITAAAEVIIVEQPKCSQTVTDIAVEGDIVEYTCKVIYDGHWAPILKWSEISSDMALVVNQTDDRRAKYTLVTSIHRDMHMRPLTCNAMFNLARYQLPIGHAKNTPPDDVFQGCETKPLDVHWPPSEDRIIIYPEKTTYDSGERIHCTVETNPFANVIRWLDNNNETLSLETMVTGEPGKYRYTCEVSNVVGRPGSQQLRSARKHFHFSVGSTEQNSPISLKQQSNESAHIGIQPQQLLILFLLNWIIFYSW